MINSDNKGASGNDIPSSSNMRQSRRRVGQSSKTSLSSATIKRLRTPRSTKTSRTLISTQQLEPQHPISTSQQVHPVEMSTVSVYNNQQWPSRIETDNQNDPLYHSVLYPATVHTPTTNSNGNSTACVRSVYSYDNVTSHYTSNTVSNNNNNTSDYSYHNSHHFHSHPSHTLYQHHRGSNFDTSSTNQYYHQQPMLHDHHSNPCSLSFDMYPTNNSGTCSLQQQQIDPNDEHMYLHVRSSSSHSSSTSLSPTALVTSNNLLSSSSSGSSSSNYTHSCKLTPSSSYLQPTSNGALTLYSHRHHPHSYHSDIETLLQLNTNDDDINGGDDDVDLSTLVNHHEIIDDQQNLRSFFHNNNHNHQLYSHNDASTSILRTVLNKPIVGKCLD